MEDKETSQKYCPMPEEMMAFFKTRIPSNKFRFFFSVGTIDIKIMDWCKIMKYWSYTRRKRVRKSQTLRDRFLARKFLGNLIEKQRVINSLINELNKEMHGKYVSAKEIAHFY